MDSRSTGRGVVWCGSDVQGARVRTVAGISHRNCPTSANTARRENPVARAVPISIEAVPTMPAHRFAEQQHAPQHAEDRDQEGHGHGGGGADVGDEAELQQVGDAEDQAEHHPRFEPVAHPHRRDQSPPRSGRSR